MSARAAAVRGPHEAPPSSRLPGARQTSARPWLATRRARAAATCATLGIALLLSAEWIRIKADAAQFLIARAWSREQQGERQARPWPWADTHPIARLRLPGSEPLIVLEGASGRTLAFGPAHDSASVLPGEAGNSVISAHRDTHFRALRRLAPGDEIRTELADGRRARFVVTDLRVVDSRRVQIALDAERPRLTLITCYPFDAINPHGPLRYIVTADRIDTYGGQTTGMTSRLLRR